LICAGEPAREGGRLTNRLSDDKGALAELFKAQFAKSRAQKRRFLAISALWRDLYFGAASPRFLQKQSAPLRLLRRDRGRDERDENVERAAP
jgi:hypothetical protein